MALADFPPRTQMRCAALRGIRQMSARLNPNLIEEFSVAS